MCRLGFCLMVDPFRQAAGPLGEVGVSAFIHSLLTTYAGRCQKTRRVTGHVWRGRFQAFVIGADGHLRTVLRYIERNPVCAAFGDVLWC
jgi:hypothetical protein